MTYGAAAAERAAIAAGLQRHGVRTGDKVGLYSNNCAEWVLTEAALTRQGVISVPLYDTLGAHSQQWSGNCDWWDMHGAATDSRPPPQVPTRCSSFATTRRLLQSPAMRPCSPPCCPRCHLAPP